LHNTLSDLYTVGAIDAAALNSFVK